MRPGADQTLGLLGAGILALTAAAQPPAEAPTPADLAALEHRASDKSLSTHEREQAADHAIDTRRRLIQGLPESDAHLIDWLIDQAAAVLARLGRDGSDSAALFGIPLAAQRDAARQASAEAASDLDRAGLLAEQSFRALVARGVSQEDPRAVAMDQARTVRVPFYRARAEAILASLSGGGDRARHADAAYAAVAHLALANAAPEASRRVVLSAALLLHKTPADPADAQTSLDELAWVIRTGAEPGTAIPPITIAEAWLALIHAGIAAGRAEQTLEGARLALVQAPFSAGGRPDPLLTILASDAITSALWEQGAKGQSADLLARAASAQTELLTRSDLGLRAETIRPLVLEKLAIVSAAADPALPVPPAVRLGRAIVLARDPASRPDAIREFRTLADTPDAGDLAADALWEWAVLLTQGPQADDRLRAVKALTRLARDFPDHPRAGEAISAALAHARALAASGDNGGGPDAAARTAYADALAAATEGYPKLPDIDRWRYERARLLSDPAGSATDDLATALSLLESIAPAAAIAPDAESLHQRVQIAMLDADFRRIADLRRSGDQRAIGVLARDHTLPLARHAADWAGSRVPEALPRFRLDLADAMVEAGQPEAAAIYKELLPAEGRLPGGAPRVRLGLARAMLLSGDAAGAFPHLREIVARLDAAPAQTPSRPEAFWHAWTLMLETLLQQDADGAKRGSIRANIKRLESTDPDLGGEPWKSRIAKVRDAAR